ncbi:MAG: hypothetical protein ACYTAS_19815, partial [Planctomycetota bacterium]
MIHKIFGLFAGVSVTIGALGARSSSLHPDNASPDAQRPAAFKKSRRVCTGLLMLHLPSSRIPLLYFAATTFAS